MTAPVVTVTERGSARWRAGHPWIYRSDIAAGDAPAGPVAVVDPKGRFVGRALWSPRSEIRVRMLTRRDVEIDAAWWRDRIQMVRDIAERIGKSAKATESVLTRARDAFREAFRSLFDEELQGDGHEATTVCE